MPPERSSDSVSESGEKQMPALENSVKALRQSYGSRREMPDALSQEQINKEMDKLRNDAEFQDVSEFLTVNKLLYRKNALQRQAELEDPAKAKAVDLEEFAVVNEAQTYFEYLEKTVQRALETSEQCVVLRKQVPSVSDTVAGLEKDSETFCDELRSALDKRLLFSNALLVTNMLAVQRDRRGVVMVDQKVLVKQLELLKAELGTKNAAGLAALEVGRIEGMRIHSNKLDQEIVDLLAKKGDMPGKLLLELQSERYKQILDQQIAKVRNPRLAKQKKRYDTLQKKNVLAKEGKGKELSEEEGKEFLELQDLLSRASESYKDMEDDRRGASDAILRTAEDLSEFHEDALMLTEIQHQFKSADITSGATKSNPDDTPAEVKKAIETTTAERAVFHRERLRAFVNKFDEDVLTIGLPEQLEEFSNTSGREFVRVVMNKLSAAFTLPIPETGGARDFVRERLSGRVNEAMGWPTDKIDDPFESLTQEEQQEVLNRARSVAQVIREFDKTKISKVRNTLDVVAALPPAKNAIGQPQPNPDALPTMPQEGVTKENMQALIDEYGLPTVYVQVMRQLDADMGSPEGGGFLGEVQLFTDKINDNIGVHLDVADSLYRTGDDWMKYMYLLLAAALGGLAAGALGPKILKRLMKRTTSRPAPREAAPRSRTRGRIERSASPSLPETGTANATREVLEEIDDLPKLKNALQTAREAKDSARLGELLNKHRGILETAAQEGDDEAVKMLKALKFAENSKWAGRIGGGLAALGVLFDAYLIYQNEQNLDAAIKEGDAAKIDMYQRERGSLVTAGAIGTGITVAELASAGYLGTAAAGAMNATVIAGSGAAVPGLASAGVLAVPVVAASLYAGAAKDETLKWGATEKNYLNEPPEKLMANIPEWTNKTSAASRMIQGDTAVWALMRRGWAATSGKRYQEYSDENQRRMDETDANVNKPQREKIWKAYFMQYAPVSLGEPDFKSIQKRVDEQMKSQPLNSNAKKREIYKEIMTDVTKDAFARTVASRMRYLGVIAAPDGGFTEQTALTLSQADAYAELAEKARLLKAQGEKTFRYTDTDGSEQRIPIDTLLQTGIPVEADRRKIRKVSEWYRSQGKNTELQQKHLSLAIRLDTAEEGSDQRKTQEKIIRGDIMGDLLDLMRHDIVRGEQLLQQKTGTDEFRRLANRGKTDAYRDVIHKQLRSDWKRQTDAFIKKAMSGETTPKDYAALRADLTSLLQEEPTSVYARASGSLKTFLDTKADIRDQIDLSAWEEQLEELRGANPPKPLTDLLAR
jgi:hypothetical protein